MSNEFRYLLENATARREGLVSSLKDTEIWRWFNSAGDGFEGITVDQMGPFILVEEHTKGRVTQGILRTLGEYFVDKPLYLKKKWSLKRAERVGFLVKGSSPQLVFNAKECGMRFCIELDSEGHAGIFPDSRETRKYIRQISVGKRVLNLFSYTAGFGMAAVSGGAESTVNIDNKNSAIRKGLYNYRLNSFSYDNRTFFKCDALHFLKRAQKQKGRYNLIVVDPPPSFKRRKQSDFKTHIHYPYLLNLCASVADDNAKIVAGFNSTAIDNAMIGQIVEEAVTASQKIFELEAIIGPGEDFPFSKERPTASFAVIRLKQE